MQKSFLKWAGGKSQSLELIKSTIPGKPRRLVEPFVGSAVVSLNVEAESYLLADYNQDLIDVFRTLKDLGTDFVAYCKEKFVGGNNKDIFYYNRNMFNALSSGTERSALFIYLNRHCFNGLCRYNSSGKFNVPFGKYNTVYFPEKEMLNFIDRSDRYEFMCCSFEETFKRQKPGDVIYCDPPYIPLNATSAFTDYTDKGFPFEMQRQLVECAEGSINPVLISNHWVPGVTEDLYKNGNTDLRKQISRSISARGSSRGKVEEVLVTYNL